MKEKKSAIFWLAFSYGESKRSRHLIQADDKDRGNDRKA